MLKSNFEFEVLIHGSSAKEYYHKGSHYIEGKEGTKFSLRMRNNSNHRVLFVPTVDGLSIMSGKEASFKSKGYIVDAYDALTIDGWRTSDDKVAQFFFSSPKQSYAQKIDKGGNLGVIGCAVFKEKERIQVIEKIIEKHIPYPVFHGPKHQCNNSYCFSCNSSETLTYTSATALTPCSAGGEVINNFFSQSSPTGSSMNVSCNVSSAGLGTGFGQDKYSPVITVDFDKEESPAEIFSIYYNTRKNLEDLGIEFRKVVYVTPSAFPEESGYCKRPD